MSKLACLKLYIGKTGSSNPFFSDLEGPSSFLFYKFGNVYPGDFVGFYGLVGIFYRHTVFLALNEANIVTEAVKPMFQS